MKNLTMAIKVNIVNLILLVCMVEFIYPKHIIGAPPRKPKFEELPSVPDYTDPWSNMNLEGPDDSFMSHRPHRPHHGHLQDEEVEITTESKIETSTSEVTGPETGGSWVDKVGTMVPWIKWDPSKWNPSNWLSHPQ